MSEQRPPKPTGGRPCHDPDCDALEKWTWVTARSKWQRRKWCPLHYRVNTRGGGIPLHRLKDEQPVERPPKPTGGRPCPAPGCDALEAWFWSTRRSSWQYQKWCSMHYGRVHSRLGEGGGGIPLGRPKGERWDMRGALHCDAKLCPDDVRAIRRRSAEGESKRSLASEFGVTYRTVWDAVKRRTWAWLPDA